MKIGIDLDGVVLDTEKVFKNYAELYDIKELKRDSTVKPNEIYIQDRYDWDEEEESNFLNKYLILGTKNANIMPGAKEVIEELRKDGHELIVITARGADIEEMIDTAKELIEKSQLKFDKYYWKVSNKAEICKKENIDVMIDDNIYNCKKVADEGIKTIYLRDSNIKTIEHPNIKECYLWGEIYRYISNFKKEI